MPDDVRAPLKVVAVFRDLIDRWIHDPTATKADVCIFLRSDRFRDLRIVEQNVQLLLLAHELRRRILDRFETREVHLNEESLSPGQLLERRDGRLRLLLAASRNVYFCVVLQESL